MVVNAFSWTLWTALCHLTFTSLCGRSISLYKSSVDSHALTCTRGRPVFKTEKQHRQREWLHALIRTPLLHYIFTEQIVCCCIKVLNIVFITFKLLNLSYSVQKLYNVTLQTLNQMKSLIFPLQFIILIVPELGRLSVSSWSCDASVSNRRSLICRSNSCNWLMRPASLLLRQFWRTHRNHGFRFHHFICLLFVCLKITDRKNIWQSPDPRGDQRKL